MTAQRADIISTHDHILFIREEAQRHGLEQEHVEAYAYAYAVNLRVPYTMRDFIAREVARGYSNKRVSNG